MYFQSVPKVSPPVGSPSIRQHGNVIDKIQAELAETKRREDELKRQRRDMFRSQPDLTTLHTSEEIVNDVTEENYDVNDVESEVFTKDSVIKESLRTTTLFFFRKRTHHLWFVLRASQL